MFVPTGISFICAIILVTVKTVAVIFGVASLIFLLSLLIQKMAEKRGDRDDL